MIRDRNNTRTNTKEEEQSLCLHISVKTVYIYVTTYSLFHSIKRIQFTSDIAATIRIKRIRPNGTFQDFKVLLFSVHISYGKGKYLNQTGFF